MSEPSGELQRLQALDPAILTAVHDQYFPEVYRYARYRLDDSLQAEDVASEVFLKLLEALKSGRGPRSNLRGWLFGTASHLIADHYRAVYSRQPEALPSDLPAEGPDPAQAAERMDHARQLRLALTKLTSDQQEVIALRFGSGFSLQRTAEVLGKNANAIKALQFRALAALRRHLEARLG